jgi:predicted Zn finger-like uncharacterized protein
MTLQCPNCGADILAENINIQEMVALCGDCNHVFSFKGSISRRKSKRRQLPLPNRVQTNETDDGLEISYKMIYSGGPMFGFIMSTIGSILLPLAFIAILTEKNNVEVVPMMMIGAGILWAWYLLAAFVMTTTHIQVNDEALVVKTGPLPLPIKDDKVIQADTITRLYREEVNDPFPSNNVRAEIEGGDQLKVVTSLPQEHATYIAQTIDNYLHSDEPVDVVAPGDEFYDDVEQSDDDLAHYEEDRAKQNR